MDDLIMRLRSTGYRLDAEAADRLEQLHQVIRRLQMEVSAMKDRLDKEEFYNRSK